MCTSMGLLKYFGSENTCLIGVSSERTFLNVSWVRALLVGPLDGH